MNKKFFMMWTAMLLMVMFFTVSCSKSATGYNKPAEIEKDAEDVSLYPGSRMAVNGTKWGYIDSNGGFVIEPIFDAGQDFQDNGLAIITLGDFQGIINKAGEYVVQPQCDFINWYHDERAVIGDGKSYKVIDEKGHVIFESQDYIQDMKDGRAVFSKQTGNGQYLYGYIDKNGQIAIEPKYERANSFNDGKAVVKLDGGPYALIDLNGNVIKGYDYYFVGNFSDGLMAFEEKEGGKTGYINEQGEIIIPPQFSWGDEFENGLAVINLSDNYYDKKSGLINKKGEFIIKPEYSDIRILGENRAAVGVYVDADNPAKGSKYALADEKGKLLTEFKYDYIYDYYNGLASAQDNISTFFINAKGEKEKSMPVVKGIGDLFFVEDLIKADVDRRISYYDKEGKLIWEPEIDVLLENGVIVQQEKYRPNKDLLIYYPQLDNMESKSVQNEVNKKIKDIFIPEQYRDIKNSDNLDYSYEADYNIKFYKKDLLNIEMIGYEYPFGAAHGMPVKEYIHLNIQDGMFYQLKDLFKEDSDYTGRLSAIIKQQIEEKGDEMGVWMEDYKGIQPDQPFIILENELQIYFTPYEIAPYAAGFPTFTIPYEEIMKIIDTEGGLWKSFH
ncbi:WG repeat-containing protein [Petroclostridium sp. X23]|uniref:WG repeat-containing protein n=1 Tax=Petroclostridium sp. X23 TaxID=3045146 RepID=UPI0024AD8EB7|nr:WG repeat-containing protein [Petroclostridium sp. X23]WHH58147.1 WG repeat-containing protein [Petroclostridium sp. X23]